MSEQEQGKYGKVITEIGNEYETGMVDDAPGFLVNDTDADCDRSEATWRDNPSRYAYFTERTEPSTGDTRTILKGYAHLELQQGEKSIGIKKEGCDNPNIYNVDKVVLCYMGGIAPLGYQYEIWVYGGGPSGYRPYSQLILEFTDESGDTYKLMLYKHSKSWHYLRYNSDEHAIVKIKWYRK